MRSYRFTILNVSMKKDFVLIISKLMLAFITRSGYIVANALYSLGVGAAKYHIIKNQNSSYEHKIHVYLHVGCCIIFSSLCYMAYSIRLFYTNQMIVYPLPVAVVIAGYTFIELFLIIRSYLKARKEKDIETEQIKLLNLATICICIVLTHAAIMSAVEPSGYVRKVAISGIVFGWGAGCIGIHMLRKYFIYKRRLIVWNQKERHQ